MKRSDQLNLLNSMGDSYRAVDSDDHNDLPHNDPFIININDCDINTKKKNQKSLRNNFSTPNFLNVGLTNQIIKSVEENKSEMKIAGVEEESSEETQKILRKQFMDSIKTKFFCLGFSFGASLQSFFVSVILLFVSHSGDSGPIQELSHQYYPIFRSIFLISFYFLLYGANLFIWRRAKIDYHRVMGFSYSHSYQFVLQGSSTCAHIMFSMFIMYVLTITGGFGAREEKDNLKHIWPFLAFFLPLFIFLFPNDKVTQPIFGVDRHGFKQRIGLVWNLLAVLVSPFSEVTFYRSFLADILCSMPKVFTDIEYTVCIYATGSIIASENFTTDPRPHAYYTCGNGSPTFYFLKVLLSLLPYYLRLMQSLRSYRDSGKIKALFNALKYLLSLLVGVLATLKQIHPDAQYILSIWFYVSIVTTAYALFWDIKMDWGLGNFNAEHFFLRSSDTLLFPAYIYYCGIAINSIFRLGWAIYISPGNMILEQHFVLLLGCVELLRRFLWGIFRVEWEHVCLQSEESVSQRVAQRIHKISQTHSNSNESFFRESVLRDEENNLEVNKMDSSDGMIGSNSYRLSINEQNNDSSSEMIFEYVQLPYQYESSHMSHIELGMGNEDEDEYDRPIPSANSYESDMPTRVEATSTSLTSASVKSILKKSKY